MAVIMEDTVMAAMAMGAVTEDTDTEDLSDTEAITEAMGVTVMGADMEDMDTEVIVAMVDMADMASMDSTGNKGKPMDFRSNLS
ncbi:hypothetical protein IscW_ISCW023572 [Ixodes scapularis]|uniref:Uncharacterized protein n=1 Tax=Ixodes scapularis TaxID=6945 RepID=B7QL94_IXOSC|nr:hypothetical protein IscW_ISCW023572 [Ixodes scapularis]|eukprot:XP_002415949.1 hypothetical protein IscW_ISCW023572 [Ixodes scapularis]